MATFRKRPWTQHARRLQIELATIQKITDETGKEISASDIWETFQETYFNEMEDLNFRTPSIQERIKKVSKKMK